MIIRTYGFMGLGAAIGFWILGLMHDPFTSSFITLGMCFAFATFMVLKRNAIKFAINQYEAS